MAIVLWQSQNPIRTALQIFIGLLPVPDGNEPNDKGEDEIGDPQDDDDGETGAEQSEVGVQDPVGRKKPIIARAHF